jgi:hypothetical protein
MKDSVAMMNFIRSMSNESDLIAFSIGDFLPINKILGYQSARFEDNHLIFEVNDDYRANVARINMLVISSTYSTQEQIYKCINDIKSHFNHATDIYFATRQDNQVDSLRVDLVLYGA